MAFSQHSSPQHPSKTGLIPDLMTGLAPTPWPCFNRIWTNTNAQTDLWLSLLSGLQLDPVACLPGSICVDFLGDQWSYFSPSPDHLYAVYGLEIQKIHLWRPLREHLHEQLGAGRMLIIEVAKSWLLHLNLIGEKDYPSSQYIPIALNEFDEIQQICGYFHGNNYQHLEGEAYQHCFAPLSDSVSNAPANLLNQAHVLSVHGWVHRPQHALVQQSWQLLEHVCERIPTHSPVERWQHRYAQDAVRYGQADPALFTAWTASNVQPFGVACELASWYLLWTAHNGRGGAHMVQAADTFRQLSVLAKALHLKSERAYQLGQLMDATDFLERMARHWHKGMELLRQSLSLPWHAPSAQSVHSH